jgi:hypothetical protein
MGQTISHFRILEKPPTTSGQVGEGGMSQNGPRTLSVPLLGFRSLSGILVPLYGIPPSSSNYRGGRSGMSGCRFEDPPSFWRRCAS